MTTVSPRRRRRWILSIVVSLAACQSAPPEPAALPPSRAALEREAVVALRTAQRDGDLDQHRRAEGLAGEIIDRFGADERALTLRAAARAGLHRFDAAVADADAAIALAPHAADPYGVLADALIELGDYERALQTVQYLLEIKPSHAAYARAAYLRALFGDQAGGLRLMQLAVDAAPTNAPAERAWHLVHLGRDALAAGDEAVAERAFRAALATRPDSRAARAGLAALRAGRGDHDGAIAAYEALLAEAPSPDTHAALVDLLVATGRNDEAARHLAAAERLERAELATGTNEHRHLALLLADHGTRLDEAIQLAARDAAARDDIYSADTLAWTLFRAGRLDEARAAAARALRLGTRDPLLQYHAGTIAAAAGDAAEAARLLSAAIARPAVLGPRRVSAARQALADA